MKSPEEIASLSREDLLALVAEQQRQIGQLTTTIERLRAEITRLQRGAKRQAAPFSKGSRVANPKRPGRKPGSGPFSFRQAPRPEEITEPPVEVPVTLESCPGCGGKLEEERVDPSARLRTGFAYITYLPPMPRPKVTQYRVWVRRCTVCGQRVRGQHPDPSASSGQALTPDQLGATAHRVGGRTMAAAHTLHYGVGIPVRRVPAVLRVLTGVELTQGAVTQACPERSRRDALRRAGGAVGMAYAGLRTTVRHRPVVHTDDTGWRVGGESAFLMAFETDETTVYQVRPRHRNSVPPHLTGVMLPPPSLVVVHLWAGGRGAWEPPRAGEAPYSSTTLAWSKDALPGQPPLLESWAPTYGRLPQEQQPEGYHDASRNYRHNQPDTYRR